MFKALPLRTFLLYATQANPNGYSLGQLSMRDPQSGDKEATSLAYLAEKNPNRWDLRNQSMATCNVTVTLGGYLEPRSKRAERNSTDYFI